MDISVLFRKLKYLESALFCDIVCAVGFNRVIRHIAQLNTPVVDIVGAAFVKHCSGRSA